MLICPFHFTAFQKDMIAERKFSAWKNRRRKRKKKEMNKEENRKQLHMLLTCCYSTDKPIKRMRVFQQARIWTRNYFFRFSYFFVVFVFIQHSILLFHSSKSFRMNRRFTRSNSFSWILVCKFHINHIEFTLSDDSDLFSVQKTSRKKKKLRVMRGYNRWCTVSHW